MELLRNLFEGYPNLWGGGVAHSVLILSLVITFGIMLGKLKVAGISLGVTWILFVGIVFGHFDMNLDEHLLHFLKEFGLILFVYSIGLQVGPGFFSAFKKGGLTLNMVAMLSVFLSVVITIVLHFATGIPITTMVGILSGAVTNTPGLGAAQQANSDLNGVDAPEIALGYAVAYPLGVVLMMGYVKLTQASHDLTAKQSQLQQVQEERVALGVAYEKAFDQAAVKAAAQAAGMTKPTSDQIEYIELGGADMAEICRPESTGPLAQAWTWLKDGIGAVVEYFR